MKNKSVKNKLICVFISLLLIIIAFIGGQGLSPAFADSSANNSILTDLQKDSNFNIYNYLDNSNDFNVQIIQVAESKQGGLYVYTYQPCQKTTYLFATKISMSLTDKMGGVLDPETELTDKDKPDLYDLKCVGINGVFGKYLVQDFKVTAEATRYYNIATIYRKYLDGIDKKPEGDNTTQGKGCTVGQLWEVTGSGKSINYDMTLRETIKIDNQYISFLRYSDGFQFDGTKNTDVHFYAFSTSNEIDNLRSADMVFYTTAYEQLAGQAADCKPPVKHSVTLYGEECSNDGSGWGGKKYTWDVLSSTKDFIANAEKQGFTFDASKRAKILENDWIINFYNTKHTTDAGGKDVLITAFIPFGWIWTIINACTTFGEYVSDVALLRLEYDYGGKVYNVGVVGDIGTGAPNPVNAAFDFFAYIWNCIVKTFKGTATAWEIFVAVSVIVVCLVLIGLLLKALSLFIPFFVPVWEKLWYVVTLPFTGIKALINKIRGE